MPSGWFADYFTRPRVRRRTLLLQFERLEERLAPAIQAISLAGSNTADNWSSFQGIGSQLSADGRYVAFTSRAANLVSGDTNGLNDVFVKDLATGAVQRVSTGSAGQEANKNTYWSKISRSGGYVAFATDATNLVGGDTNGAGDVFVKDLQTGTTTRVSTDSNGVQGNDDSQEAHPAISDDGRYVAFVSRASNLTSEPTYGFDHVFVKDLQTGATKRVDTDSAGKPAVRGNYGSPQISGDGRFVFFSSDDPLVKPDLGNIDVFVKDRQTQILTRVSLDSGGNSPNGDSILRSVSRDGRYVVFDSYATNLLGNNSGPSLHVYVKDMQTGSLTPVGSDSAGMLANSFTHHGAISDDGRFVVFDSEASNLVPGDTNSISDVFLKDLQTGKTTRLSLGSAGNESSDICWTPSISGDGRYVAFEAFGDDLTSNDSNGQPDVFLWTAGTPTVVSFPQPSAVGQRVTLTATVDAGFVNPATGVVVFKDGDQSLGAAALVSGRATLSMSDLTVGEHLILAEIDGHVSPAVAHTVLAPLTVTTSTDEDNGAPDPALGAGTSLREAINYANGHPGLDFIAFNIPGSGLHTITPTSGLPAITDAVIIDGYTQPGAKANTNSIDDADSARRGFNGTLLIQLSGPAGGTPGMSGLVVAGSGSTIRGLVINGFGHNGINVSGGDNNVIVGNYIGVDPTGGTAAGNNRWGVLLNVGSAGNRIGTDGDGIGDEAERNVISANGFGGVGITGAGADNNVIAGNFIGTKSDGTGAIGNADRGVDIYLGAQRNRVGTNADAVNDAAERNVLSGNGWEGVGISGSGTSFNVVAGNLIGVDVSGILPVPNGRSGIGIFGGATGNMVGGMAAGTGNTIARNTWSGVTVTNTGTVNNSILGNSIFRNSYVGIDLGNNYATTNDVEDADSGPNNLQNLPVIGHATRSKGLVKVTYNVPSATANSTYPIRVEFFQADIDGLEGQTFLGFDMFTAADFASGSKKAMLATAAPVAVFDKVVATATDSLAAGGPANTSEFSASTIVASPWQNARARLDVDDDRHIAPGDPLAVINYINTSGSHAVPNDAENAKYYVDVSGDNFVAPNDSLEVINYINQFGPGDAEGENGRAAHASRQIAALASDVLAILAADLAAQPRRKGSRG